MERKHSGRLKACIYRAHHRCWLSVMTLCDLTGKWMEVEDPHSRNLKSKMDPNVKYVDTDMTPVEKATP